MEAVGGTWVRRRTKVLGPLCRPCKVVLGVAEVATAVKQNYHKDTTIECKSGNVKVHIRIHE